MNEFSHILSNLPKSPGVYQFFDENGKIIYVGKAKSLKSRVSSYFTSKRHESAKTHVLVRKIRDIKYIVVPTEQDALLLENTLIKEHRPRYNIMLKDDKTYPFICVKNERFPRVFSTRNVYRDGSTYFGPYASVKMMNTVLDLVRQLYPLRNCNYALSEKNIEAGKFKVCLEYHIKNCKGPCEGLQTEEDYNLSIDEIKYIIRGNIRRVTRHLEERMKKMADALEFEKAELLREKIEILSNYQSKSTVVSPSIRNLDVYSMIEESDAAYVNYMKVVNGAIVQGHTIELKKKLDETSEDLLLLAMTELQQRFLSDAKEVLVPFIPDVDLHGKKMSVPQRGDKKQLLELSQRNARYYILEKMKQMQKVDPERHSKRIMEQIKADLRLPEMPVHIECFDNSNFQGTNPVAACVVFKNAKPSKKDYRHFNIKTVEGPDDFASMEEIIHRRYSRLMNEGADLPQLIVIDGGKGQLNAALKSLDRLGLRGKISIVGIAKRLEELFFPGDPVPLYLDKRSESLKVIQQLRNEAHRFGITHHRQQRSKSTIKSELSEIKGIGYRTAQDLLRKFKSVKRIREASEEELAAVISKSRAKIVYDHFH